MTHLISGPGFETAGNNPEPIASNTPKTEPLPVRPLSPEAAESTSLNGRSVFLFYQRTDKFIIEAERFARYSKIAEFLVCDTQKVNSCAGSYEISPEIAKSVDEYVVSGKPIAITRHNIVDLLEFIDRFDIPSVWEFLKNRPIQVIDALKKHLMEIADENVKKNVILKIARCVVNFDSLEGLNIISQLTNDPKILAPIITHAISKVVKECTEKEALAAIYKWVQDPNARIKLIRMIKTERDSSEDWVLKLVTHLEKGRDPVESFLPFFMQFKDGKSLVELMGALEILDSDSEAKAYVYSKIVEFLMDSSDQELNQLIDQMTTHLSSCSGMARSVDKFKAIFNRVSHQILNLRNRNGTRFLMPEDELKLDKLIEKNQDIRVSKVEDAEKLESYKAIQNLTKAMLRNLNRIISKRNLSFERAKKFRVLGVSAGLGLTVIAAIGFFLVIGLGISTHNMMNKIFEILVNVGAGSMILFLALSAVLYILPLYLHDKKSEKKIHNFAQKSFA